MVNTDNKFTFQRHIGHIRPDNKIILPEFLNAQLNTSFVRKQADLKVRGVAQKTLNLDELRKLCVVVPSLEEQRSFVERLKDLQLVQNTQSHSSVAIEELFSSLLSRSFA
jgi:type I restriction enzyme S subunit